MYSMEGKSKQEAIALNTFTVRITLYAEI